MKKVISFLILSVLSLSLLFVFAGCNNKIDVVIYSSMEDFRNEKLKEMMKEQFPDLKIDLQYIPSGNNAARIKAEGTKIEADIVLDIDYGLLESLKDNFAELTSFDNSVFADDVVIEHKKYFPLSKFAIGVIVNDEKLAAAGVAAPTSYQDLVKPEYRNLIMMPNPVASGTGYGFLKGMVNLMGEAEAFTYFDGIASNRKDFTSSGSGPVNGVSRGECAVAIGMVFQAVNEINKGSNIRILHMDDGFCFNVSGSAVISGRETDDKVMQVYNFIMSSFLRYDKINYLPEQIFADQEETVIENYPKNLKFTNMTGFNDPAEKERLLSKWKY